MNLTRNILNFVWRLFRTVTLVAIVLSAMFVVAIDKMLPRQIITLAVPGLAVLGIVLLTVLMKRWVRIPINIPKGRELDDMILGYVRGHKVRVFVLIVAFFAAISLPRIISNYIDQGRLNDSLQHFSVISTPTVSKERVSLTRVVLEKSLREIGSYAKVAITNPIKVHLYSNTREFQEATGSPPSVSGLTRWTDQGPEIYIPAELPPDRKSVLNNGTPVHELTHAIELLVTNNPRSMPLWIREGLANQHQDFWERVFTHVGVWLERDKILSYERLSLFRYDYPQEESEKQLFYSTSYEFMRYLYMHYGESTVWEIIRAVGERVSYESAISNATGRNEKELYHDWLRDWLQGWQVNIVGSTTIVSEDEYERELWDIQTAVMAMLVDSTSGNITNGPVTDAADMHAVQARKGAATLYLSNYLIGLDGTLVKSGCTYTFATDGTVTQTRP